MKGGVLWVGGLGSLLPVSAPMMEPGCWPSRSPTPGTLTLRPGGPTLTVSISPPQGPHQHRGPLGSCSRLCVKGPLFSPLLETHDLAVHQGLCLKDPEMGVGGSHRG